MEKSISEILSDCKCRYFLGSVSSEGFVTHFGREIAAEGMFTYILKGGAGTGKSSLMKKLAAKMCDRDDVVLYFCSSDPDSLDAVIFKKAGVIIVDGTSPHVFDPIYAGVNQKIINLGECWDDEVLARDANEIIRVTNENKRLHARAKRFITAISQLNGDIFSTAEEFIDRDKLDGFICRLSKKLKLRSDGQRGKITFSQLSALTPKGYITQTETLKKYENTYVLSDEMFAGADYFIKSMTTVLTERGIDCVISPCNLVNGGCYEHLLVPELKAAFVLSNSLNQLSSDSLAEYKTINFLRFYNKAALQAKKQRITFNKKAAEDLTLEAVNSLNTAKLIHDDIEGFYIKAMDFSGVDKIIEDLLRKITHTIKS